MTFLKEHYRELLTNYNFLMEKRFVFGGDTPNNPDTTVMVETGKKGADTTAAATKPMDTKNWEEHQTKIDRHLQVLEETDKPKYDAQKAKLTKDMGQLKAEYETALKVEQGKTNKPTSEQQEKIAKQFQERVNTLLAKIKEDIPEKDRSKADEAEQKTTDAQQGAPDTADKSKKETFKLKTGPNGQLEKAMKILGKQYESLKNPVVAKIVQEQVVSKMDFSANQLAQIERGVEKNALKLSADQVEEIKKAMPEQIGEYDSAEGNLLESFFESQKDKDIDSEAKKEGMSAIEELFADDNDPMRVYMSKMYKITKNEKGELTIEDPNKKIKTKDNKPEIITKAKQLERYLPEGGESQKIFKALIEGKDIEKNVKEFTEDAELQLKGLDAMKELQGSLFSQETLDKAEAMGPLGGLAMLIKLFAAIKKAFNDQDWDTLGDFMKDWNETKDPKKLMEKQENSKKAYEEAMKDPKPAPDIQQTLEAYLNPRGKEANELFQNSFEKGLTAAEIAAHPLSRYRAEAKPYILNYMAKELGLKEITAIDKNSKEITAIRKDDNKKVAIEFDFSGGKTKARVVPYEKKPGEDGKETLVKAEDNIGDFKEVTFAELGKMLGKKPADAAGAEAAKPGEKGQEGNGEATEKKESDARLDKVSKLTKEDMYKFVERLNAKKDKNMFKKYFDFKTKFKKEDPDCKRWAEAQVQKCQEDFLKTLKPKNIINVDVLEYALTRDPKLKKQYDKFVVEFKKGDKYQKEATEYGEKMQRSFLADQIKQKNPIAIAFINELESQKPVVAAVAPAVAAAPAVPAAATPAAAPAAAAPTTTV